MTLRTIPQSWIPPKPGFTFTATARAVQGESLVALTAEAAWGVVAVSSGATWARLGQAFVIVCIGQRMDRVACAASGKTLTFSVHFSFCEIRSREVSIMATIWDGAHKRFCLNPLSAVAKLCDLS